MYESLLVMVVNIWHYIETSENAFEDKTAYMQKNYSYST